MSNLVCAKVPKQAYSSYDSLQKEREVMNYALEMGGKLKFPLAILLSPCYT